MCTATNWHKHNLHIKTLKRHEQAIQLIFVSIPSPPYPSPFFLCFDLVRLVRARRQFKHVWECFTQVRVCVLRFSPRLLSNAALVRAYATSVIHRFLQFFQNNNNKNDNNNKSEEEEKSKTKKSAKQSIDQDKLDTEVFGWRSCSCK